MTPIERLQNALTTLGLKAVDARLEGLLEQAAKKEPSYADFLDEVLACEVDARRSRYLRARLQLSHLPFVKTFDQFDFAFQPSIDEMGYLPLDDLGATIFFQLVSARYERGSIILTSNKSYGDWGSIFGDTIIATAILDRLLHHSTTINIRGESCRLKDRRRAGLLPRAEDQQPPPAMVAMNLADAPGSRAKRSHSS
jgi:DNA replication protein DnaC